MKKKLALIAIVYSIYIVPKGICDLNYNTTETLSSMIIQEQITRGMSSYLTEDSEEERMLQLKLKKARLEQKIKLLKKKLEQTEEAIKNPLFSIKNSKPKNNDTNPYAYAYRKHKKEKLSH